MIPEILRSLQPPLANDTYVDDNEMDAVLTSIGKETNFCSVILRYDRSVIQIQGVIVSYLALSQKAIK